MGAWSVPLGDVRFTDSEIEAVAAVYRSGWLSQGPLIAEFEGAMSEYLGGPHTVAVSSGTAALHLSCVSIGLGEGDEVLLPSLTFAATAATIRQTGAVPVFADITAVNRPWLSVDAVRAAMGPRTRAIVNVAYGGHPGDVLALRELAREHCVTLIEDAAHAIGARASGLHAGTIGDVGAFSFFANKNLPLGEGGMLVTGDAALAERARLLRSHGLNADTWTRHRGDAADYEVLEAGFNYRLDEPRAALGTLLLRRLEADNCNRLALARSYERGLALIDGVEGVIGVEPEPSSAWHIYPLLLDTRIDRATFRHRLQARGVQTSVHYPPLHETRAFAPADGVSLPVTEEYAKRTVTVPLFPHMSESQLGHVLAAIKDASGA